jgi:hypothetical protein
VNRIAALLAAVVVALALPGAASAQGRPDFTGTWTLDLAKSNMGAPAGSAAAARPVVLVITQTATVMTVERRAGDRSDSATLKLDGTESVNKTPSGADVKTTAKWVGATLVTHAKMTVGDSSTESTDVRSLSADGRVMTIETTQKMGGREIKRSLVYNKQ